MERISPQARFAILPDFDSLAMRTLKKSDMQLVEFLVKMEKRVEKVMGGTPMTYFLNYSVLFLLICRKKHAR